MKCEYVSELGTLRISCKNTRLEFQNLSANSPRNWARNSWSTFVVDSGSDSCIHHHSLASSFHPQGPQKMVMETWGPKSWDSELTKGHATRLGLSKKTKTSRLNNRSGHQQVKKHMCHQLYSTCYYFSLFSWWLFTDSTVVKHHEKPPFGEYVLFFSNHQNKQS